MNAKLNDIQNDIKESTSKIWLAGMGALAMAGEEGQKLFNSLVEKGEDFDAREKAPVEAVKQTVGSAKERVEDIWGKFEDAFNDKVAVAMQKIGVPTRAEISNLTERVDALMVAINKLNVNTPEEVKSETTDK